MSATTSDQARDIYIVGLRNQHAVENQAIELLERQVGRLENYPEMEQRMRRHIEESREQARRLEDLLGQFATSHSTMKDTMMSLVGNLAAIGHTMASDEVLKNTFANFAFEHYEIASYSSLLTLAELAGHSAGRSALETSLREEKEMAAWIADHLAATTRRFVARSAVGEKAGINPAFTAATAKGNRYGSGANNDGSQHDSQVDQGPQRHAFGGEGHRRQGRRGHPQGGFRRA